MSPQTGQEGGVAGLGGLSKDELREILYKLKLCRYFDERMEALYRRGELPGAIYSGRGQEGTHVGAAYALRTDDSLFVTHRDLSAQLTKGLDLKRVMAQFWPDRRLHARPRRQQPHRRLGQGAGRSRCCRCFRTAIPWPPAPPSPTSATATTGSPSRSAAMGRRPTAGGTSLNISASTTSRSSGS